MISSVVLGYTARNGETVRNDEKGGVMNHARLLFALFLGMTLIPACGSGSGDSGKTEKTDKKKKDKDKQKDKNKEPKTPAPNPAEMAKALEGLDSEEGGPRDDAIKALVGFGSHAVKPLVGKLSSDDTVVRTAALAALARIGDKAAKSAVEDHLRNARQHEDILYGLWALGRVGDTSSMSLIEPYLTFKAPKRIPDEADWMVEKGRETDEGMVQNQAAESLARLGDPKGVPVIIENLLSNGWVRKDSLIRLRRMTDCKVDHGYSMGDSRDERKAAVEAWKAWWEKEKATFKPSWTNSCQAYDVDKR